MLSNFLFRNRKLFFLFLLIFVWGITVVIILAHNGHEGTLVRIDRGDSLADIALKLKNNGLIGSTAFFKIYSLIIGAAHRFQPGIYEFDVIEDGFFKVVHTLMFGPQPVSVVISEGLTLKDIDSKLNDSGIIKKGDLINFVASKEFDPLKNSYWFLIDKKSPEGFLFPDTYKFMPGSAPKTVVKTMLDNFSVKTALLLQNKDDWYRILVLSSLLEKEVPSYTDKVVVSGILQKRLALGMPLQIDATVTYIKCDGEYTVCVDRRLEKSDFKIDSAYNTYLYKDLPPTPIANPGLSAIQAALNPKKTSYLFYLSNPQNQKTVFSITLDEHNENRFKYLKL